MNARQNAVNQQADEEDEPLLALRQPENVGC